MKFKILKEELVFDHFFKIKKATIEHELFNSNTIQVNRLCFDRGDSVAILLYEKDTDSLLFTNQFRYPTIKGTDGWILELTAGSMEEGDKAIERVKKEVEEEIGYQINQVELIHTFFVSQGGTSERIFLFYAEVNAKDKVLEGGGLKFEKEDIQLVKLKTKEVIANLKNKQFQDAKTIIGLQWFLLNKN